MRTDPAGMPAWPAGWTGSVGCGEIGAVAVAAPIEAGHWLGVDLSGQLSELQRRWLEPLLASRDELEVLMSRSPSSISLLYSAKEALQRAFQLQIGGIMDYRAIRLARMDDEWMWFDSVTNQASWMPARMPIRVRYLRAEQWVLTVASSRHQDD